MAAEFHARIILVYHFSHYAKTHPIKKASKSFYHICAPLIKMSNVTVPGTGFRQILCLLGLILSVYAVYVEYKVHQMNASDSMEEEFHALCDIEAISASCR